MYVIETNMLQRSFNDLSVSERIAVLAERYDKTCGTKKREDILAELQALNGGGGHDVNQQAKSRELLGKELGLTGQHVARYVRCKDFVEKGGASMEKMGFDKRRCMSAIYAIAKEKGVKIGDLEKETGVSTGYLSKLNKEENTSSPSIELLVAAAQLLGVTVDMLI